MGRAAWRVSRMFRSYRYRWDESVRKDFYESRGHKLLLMQGWLSNTGVPGHLALSSDLLRSLGKLEAVVGEELERAGALRLQLPLLSAKALWDASGRLPLLQQDLYTLSGRGEEELVLSPTFEEAMTQHLVDKAPGRGTFPVRLYQIGPKFRDEARPKFGLLRSREFGMADAYAFDWTAAEAEESYRAFVEAFRRVLEVRLRLPATLLQADNGAMGGSLSHEFHLPVSAGQDAFVSCGVCGHAALVPKPRSEDEARPPCDRCQSSETLLRVSTEVSHCFQLGDRYTRPMGLGTEGGAFAQMGCFGLGLTRLLGAAVDGLSSDDSLRWPQALAPYRVAVLGPKRGSREEGKAGLCMDQVADGLAALPGMDGEVVLDDRLRYSVGRRLRETSRRGFPVLVVGNKSLCEPLPRVEVFLDSSPDPLLLTHSQLFHLVQEKFEE